MAGPKHPRHFADGFKGRVVSPRNAGKPPSETTRECDPGVVGRGGAAGEPTGEALEAEPVHGDGLSGLRDPQAKPSGRAHWRDSFGIHSTPGRMGPVEFGKAGPTLSKPSK